MKSIVLILILFLLYPSGYIFAGNPSVYQMKADTSIEQSIDTILGKEQDKVIEEVIQSKSPVKEEKVKYISQVTRYGFKNLFKNYSYNSAIPYSSQVNPYAENYMEDYLKSHSQFLINLKKNSVPQFNFINGILVQYGLPTELKYLAVIESNLKPNALSSAGARGPWQFMSYTARDYGLQVNQWIDERTDYYKSTHAAAKYLLSLYKDLKDWLLVIAAYNGGPGRVYSAIKKSGSRNFWDLQYYLPQESRNHVKKFIATHYIMETGGTENLSGNSFNYSDLSTTINPTPNLSAEEKSGVKELEVSGRYKAKIIARNIEMEYKDFVRYNPGFDNMMSMGSNYTLRLPEEKMTLFIARKYPILNECVQELLDNVQLDSKTVYKKRN